MRRFDGFNGQITQNVDRKDRLVGIERFHWVEIDAAIRSIDLVFYNVKNEFDAMIGRVIIDELLHFWNISFMQEDCHVNAMLPTFHQIRKPVLAVQRQNRD